MKSIKIRLYRSVELHPVKFRVTLVAMGLVGGAMNHLIGNQVSVELSRGVAMAFLGFSTLLYTFLLTLYRILQRTFKRKIEDKSGELKDFDERSLVKIGGVYFLVMYGMISWGLEAMINSGPGNFGKTFIIQGLAMTLGAWLSQKIKK